MKKAIVLSPRTLFGWSAIYSNAAISKLIEKDILIILGRRKCRLTLTLKHKEL